MKRTDAEKDLDFVGFIIFENKLKPQTTGVIEELREAIIRKVMCTGDNILTAISVARECNLVDKETHIFVPHFIEGDARDPHGRLRWESVDNRIYTLDEHTLMPSPLSTDQDVSGPYQISNFRGYSLAVSGEVFRWVIDYAPQEVLHRVSFRITIIQIRLKYSNL
jgi:cation-transporting ATPase 13A2